MARMIHFNKHFFENTLVRYRPINENSINALKSNRLYYSTPSYFNDPYDTRVFANPLKILGNVKYNLDVGMDSFLDSMEGKSNNCINPIHAAGYAMWNGKNKEQIVDEFLGDIYYAAKMLQDSIKRNSKIICLSEDYLSMLMWSHYADNHKGFAIIYDKNKIVEADNISSSGNKLAKGIHLCKVNYVEQQLDLSEEVEEYVRVHMVPALSSRGVIPSERTILTQEKIRTMMAEKSPEWSYEKEWRVLPGHIDLNKESELAYMNIKAKAVIIGSMCSHEDREEIINICRKNFIPVLEAYLDSCSPGFRLAIKQLE